MPKRHAIIAGESVILLSERYGHFSDTIWSDAANDALRAQRPSMNALLAGDVVVIPDVRQKQVAVPTGKRHVFRRRGIPALFRVQVLDGGVPRAGQEWVLTVDGVEHIGTSDAEGIVEQYVPAGAAVATLVIGPDALTLEFQIGQLQPVNTLAGARQRLQNLGYFTTTSDLDAATRSALGGLQRREGLPVTGELDEATQARLSELHDGNEGA